MSLDNGVPAVASVVGGIVGVVEMTSAGASVPGGVATTSGVLVPGGDETIVVDVSDRAVSARCSSSES